MTDKDGVFIRALTANTANGRVTWEPTAIENRLTSSVKGKYNLTISEVEHTYSFVMTDSEGHEMLRITSYAGSYMEYTPEWNERELLISLFETARRAAFSVDSAIDDIMRDFPGEG